jgi:hypothetical protein
MNKSLLAAMFLLAATVPARAGDSGGISGYVRDDRGLPLPHAVVQFQRLGGLVGTVRTDDSGFFSDITLEPGRYMIRVDGVLGSQSSSCVVRDVFGGEVARLTIGVGITTRDCDWGQASSLVDPNATADVYRI